MTINPLATTIRTRKLGVLLRDARLTAGKNIQECAQAVGVNSSQYEAYELGETSPSLPEVEILAYFLNVPFDYFKGNVTASKIDKKRIKVEPQQVLKIRQRMIGVLIKQTRLEAGMTIDDVSHKVGLSPNELENYEMGETPIPLPILEALALDLNRPVKVFQDRQGPIGKWETQQRAIQSFVELSIELQTFVTKPINRPYLELAQRLSEMSVEKLRGVAEGLLEITL